MLSIFKDIYQRRELVWMLVVRNLKIRYKNTALGFFWSLLGPIFMIGIYSIFLGFLKVDIPLPVLVTGIIVWQFLAMCLGDSLNSILGNANLVTKTSFPRIILPLAMVNANFINFLLSFAVLFVYLLVVGADIGALYMLPLVMITQFALCFGVALLVACSNVYFRDTEHILSMVMMAWFFTSAVIYPLQFILDRLPQTLHVFLFFNPMIGIITSYRMCLLSDAGPGLDYIGLSYFIAWIILFIGISVFKRCEPGFGDEL